MMVHVDVIAVCGADREQNLDRRGECERAHSEAASGRRRECGRATNQTPLSGGIAWRIFECVARPQHESFDGAKAEHDLADDEGCECATRHEATAPEELSSNLESKVKYTPSDEPPDLPDGPRSIGQTNDLGDDLIDCFEDVRRNVEC